MTLLAEETGIGPYSVDNIEERLVEVYAYAQNGVCAKIKVTVK